MSIEQAESVLREWGEWMRRTPGLAQLGYPSESPGAEQRRHNSASEDKSTITQNKGQRRHMLRCRDCYRLEGVMEKECGACGGKLSTRVVEVVHPMVPRSQPHQTASRKPMSGDPWPEHIMQADAIMARMPYRQSKAIKLQYYIGASSREGAKELQISHTAYRNLVDNAVHMFAGMWMVKAS